MNSLREALHHDHVRLDALFEEVLNRVHVNDAEAAEIAWTSFDRGLSAHLAAEEAEILPVFERVDPAEAAAIRVEHARIRLRLVELGVMLDIHLLREAKVEAFIGSLRAHAAREEALLYRFADAELAEEPRRSVLARLHAAEEAARAWGKKLTGDLGGVML